MIFVVKSTNYKSHCHALCLPSCHFLSLLSVLHFTTLFTSLTYRHVSQFMYFVCKRVCTRCEALTMVLLVIHFFQDVTQRCLDLLLDKYLYCGEHSAQIMHNLKWALYSVSSVFHNNMITLWTFYCVIYVFMVCGYLSPWHEVSSGYRWSRGLPDMEGRCQCIE